MEIINQISRLSKYRKICTFFICFTLSVFGILLAIWCREIFNFILRKLFDLTPGGSLYKGWNQPPPIMTFDAYLFNWTNPQDFEDEFRKPEFKEIGPFRFNVRVEKTNVTYNKDNDTISYRLKKWYEFNRKESVQDLDFEIVMINQMSSVIAYKVKDMNYFIKKSVSISLHSMSSLYVKKTVGELLFQGYSDPILDAIRSLPIFLPDYITDKFGFFYKKNGSSDGLFNIGTGRGKTKLGTLYNWDGRQSTEFYNETCRNINGISQDFFTDNIKDGKIEILNPDLCRKTKLDFKRMETVHGVECHRFEIGDSFLDNGTKIRGNECFCADLCMRSGSVPATLCHGKANHYLTLPHFLKADPYYADQIIGMKPDYDKHSFNIFVEPVTGSIFKFSAKMQVNIFIEPIQGISMMKAAPTALFPLLWVENSFEIPESDAFSMKILLSLEKIMVFTGLTLFSIGILLYILELRRQRNSFYKKEAYSKEMRLLKGSPDETKPRITEGKSDVRKFHQ